MMPGAINTISSAMAEEIVLLNYTFAWLPDTMHHFFHHG